MIQTTVFQVDDYGPWTVTPSPRPEMDLQTLQSRLYAEIAGFVGDREGYAFYTRGDNIVAITNRLDRDAHEQLQASIGNRYPVTVSVGFDVGATPRAALASASAQLRAAGSAQDDTRTATCQGETTDADAGEVTVGHFDIENATDRLTDRLDAFEVYTTVQQWYGTLARHLYQEHESLAFFVGGDNVVAVCPSLDQEAYHDVIDYVTSKTDVPFRVGVGTGQTARQAGMAAKHGLEQGRETDQAVVMVDQCPAPGV
ncbi:GTP cyclohydrolase IIa [Halocatena pleomorpha]|uniref:GTP cyclohydrolase III n=1 Tax=Halocatena pleomorpha TaxID=1785090 RepID=A0A3P3RF59_9EURY|nr:GTP cyclohydrolase IIa [Halocatena pleomorpha]RRJ32045.1 GTP cyclohydrolase IIa [Halocatena pleomorpha]